ncbi:MAG: hypothetical protein WEC75_08825 [Dehalococcoidia bacterium]
MSHPTHGIVKEVTGLKKIVVLLGFAAAAYGALKFFRSKDDDEFGSSYVPQPQG